MFYGDQRMYFNREINRSVIATPGNTVLSVIQENYVQKNTIKGRVTSIKHYFKYLVSILLGI